MDDSISRRSQMSDLIDRQAAIEALIKADYELTGILSEPRARMFEQTINALPPAQPEERELHESCTDCPLYEKDRHSCPRFNKVIPETLREVQSEQRWIPVTKRLPEELDTKKQEICEYCHEDSDGYVKPIEKNNHAFVRFGENGWELDLKANGWHGSAKINYCPACGRKLQRT